MDDILHRLRNPEMMIPLSIPTNNGFVMVSNHVQYGFTFVWRVSGFSFRLPLDSGFLGVGNSLGEAQGEAFAAARGRGPCRL